MKSRALSFLLITVTLLGLVVVALATTTSTFGTSPLTLPRLASMSGNFTGPFWSRTEAGSGPSIATTNTAASVSIPANSSNDPSLHIFGAGLSSTCPVSGDFDVQIGFRLLNWTFANGVRVGLASTPDAFFTTYIATNPSLAVARTSLGPGDTAGIPRENYLTQFLDGVQGLIPTSDLTGALRLTRTGGTATGYYLGPTGWIAVHSGPTITQSIHLSIEAWSHNFTFTHTFVKVEFDNFTINKGSAICPSLSLSPTSGPVGTNVHAQVTGLLSSNFTPDQVLMSFDGNFLGIAINLNGTFDFTFNVPVAQPGSHLVKATDEFTSSSLSATFMVTKVDTLSLSLDVGTLYFTGDSAAVYTLATLSGSPLNSTSVQMQLTLTRPDGSVLTLNSTFLGAGLFKAVYPIPKTGPIGTYAIVAKAHVASVQDASALTTFEVKQTWLSAQGPAITTAAVALTGVAAVATSVVWRKGMFKGKNE